MRLPPKLGSLARDVALPELVALFEERAAVREHDGGMSRHHAEATAIEDVIAAIREGGVGSSFAPGLVGEWQRGLASLDRETEACPAFGRKWPAVLRVAERFLADHGVAAVAAGWTTLELFGVHAIVGTIRLDCTGALMLPISKPVVAVTADAITFANGLVFRRSNPPEGVQIIPVWEFRR